MPTDRLRASAGPSASTGLDRPVLGEFGCLVAGRWTRTGDAVDVRSPYDETLVSVVQRAGPADIERAIAGASEAFEITRRLPSWKRS